MNILLVTDVLPDASFTAGQVLRNMLRSLQPGRISVFWINQSRLPKCADDDLFEIRAEYLFEPGRAGPWLQWLINRFGDASPAAAIIQYAITLWLCVLIAFRILRQLRKLRPAYVWLVLQGEKLLLAYWLLSYFCRSRIILQQWDPLSWWMTNRGYRPQMIRLAERLRDDLQSRAWVNVVPSFPWKESLESRGCRVVRVDNFFSRSEIEQLRSPRHILKVSTPGKLNLVFLGQLYANPELEKCLSIIQAQAARKHLRLVLHYFGSGNPETISHADLFQYGYVPRDELIAMIGKWDCALLPYPCERKFSETAQLSFPSKSRVYMAAGLPIIAFAPANSSVERFFSTNYSPYYINAHINDNVSGFLDDCRSIAPEDLMRRREFALSVLENCFSESAEVNHLRPFLR